MTSPQEIAGPRGRWAGRCLLVYWPLLLLALHWPSPFPSGREPEYPDKLVHFSAYGVLATLLTLTHIQRRRRALDQSPPRRFAGYLAVFALVAVVGIVDEVTQPLTHRDFELMDWVADMAGAICGIVVAIGFSRLRRARPD